MDREVLKEKRCSPPRANNEPDLVPNNRNSLCVGYKEVESDKCGEEAQG